MVSNRGIEANLEKIKVILNMKPLQSIKEAQSLTGRPSTSLSLKLLTNVCHFLRFLRKHLSGRINAKKLSKT